MSNSSKQEAVKPEHEDDDEPDDWDKRIFSTGCSGEQTRLNDCYFNKKDWRLCKEEMEMFRQCWKRQGNDQRTATRDVKKAENTR